MGVSIEPVAPVHADGINAVYNPYVRESAATFETEEYDLKAREAWIAARTNPRHPGFVALEAARVIGFANAAAFDPRGAYETSVKVSVFLAPDAKRRGIGRRLYAALFDSLGRADVHRAYALIVAPNPASVALHEAFGFARVSTLSEVGRKFGRYWDVMWFERRF
ncbi:MAG: N-acetyltransferase family protein [Parvularculaceae bacterium]|nr:N-acetyltransferase family protein [Parvularculaceae bacterium]